jgi:hypothetical protein
VGGVNLADESGLEALGVAVLEVEELEGDDGVDNDLPAEVAEVNDLLSHAPLLILINLLLLPNIKPRPSEEVMIDAVLVAKLVHLFQQLLVLLYFCSVYVDALHILAELNWTVDLDLLVGRRAVRGNFLGLGGIEGCLQLLIVHLAEDLETIFECGYGSSSCAGVHVREGAPLPDVLLEQEVAPAVAAAALDTLGIVSEVDNPILHSFEVSGLAILVAEHPVFPRCAGGSAERTRALVGLELAAVVSVLDEEFHVLRDMDVNNDGSIIFNVKL